MMKVYNDRIGTSDTIESTVLKTELLKIDYNELGEEIFTSWGHNELLQGGRMFVLQKCFNADMPFNIPTLDGDFGITPTTILNPKDRMICLFGVGLDGSGETINSVKDVDVKSKGFNNLSDMVPFRIVPKAEIGNDVENNYFCRVEDGDNYKYHLKPYIQKETKCYFEDGTPLDETYWTSSKDQPINTCIELKFEISKQDLREYFNSIGLGRLCRFNSIVLYAAVPVEKDGRTEYEHIIATNKYNCDNEMFSDDERVLRFLYRIYTS